MPGFAVVKVVREVLQLRQHEVPIVQHLLHAVGNASCIMRHGQVTGHHHQLPIARSVFVSGQFHGVGFPMWGWGSSAGRRMPEDAWF